MWKLTGCCCVCACAFLCYIHIYRLASWRFFKNININEFANFFITYARQRLCSSRYIGYKLQHYQPFAPFIIKKEIYVAPARSVERKKRRRIIFICGTIDVIIGRNVIESYAVNAIIIIINQLNFPTNTVFTFLPIRFPRSTRTITRPYMLCIQEDNAELIKLPASSS